MTEQALAGSTIDHAEPPGADDGGPVRPMRADARRNYDKLVAAARQVFLEQGGGASLEAIAKEAGVGVGTLYRHFPKRIDIVEAVYREDVDGLLSSAEEIRGGARAVARARRLARGLRPLRQHQADLPERTPRGLRGEPAAAAQLAERIEAAIDLVLLPAQEAGVVRTDLDGSDLMQLLGSMCMSATLEAGSERAAPGHDPGRAAASVTTATPDSSATRAPRRRSRP